MLRTPNALKNTKTRQDGSKRDGGKDEQAGSPKAYKQGTEGAVEVYEVRKVEASHGAG